LPLRFATGTATRVITVVAPSSGSTTATLRAWQKAGTGWTQVGAAVTAYLGTAGLSAYPSESSTATPIGSFTLTQAFGREPDPGTSLPYHQTTPADWWISQPGPLYNTMQSCVSACPFTLGNPNEHLYYEQPYYAYAVVIDYNTANSPTGVRQGAGSAFFLHVTVGQPTQGCISIAEQRLVELLRWLVPAAHPRILIGVG
jgi:L,D-peptidoglycan transpeptidase YkuD (ErfK/YbiS/YcfS/YnhG family)